MTHNERLLQKPSDDFINHGFVLSFMDEDDDRFVPIATVRLYDSDIDEIRIAYTGALHDKIREKRKDCLRIANRGAKQYTIEDVDCTPPWGQLFIIVRRCDDHAAPHTYFDKGVKSCTIK